MRQMPGRPAVKLFQPVHRRLGIVEGGMAGAVGKKKAGGVVLHLGYPSK